MPPGLHSDFKIPYIVTLYSDLLCTNSSYWRSKSPHRLPDNESGKIEREVFELAVKNEMKLDDKYYFF